MVSTLAPKKRRSQLGKDGQRLTADRVVTDAQTTSKCQGVSLYRVRATAPVCLEGSRLARSCVRIASSMRATAFAFSLAWASQFVPAFQLVEDYPAVPKSGDAKLFQVLLPEAREDPFV